MGLAGSGTSRQNGGDASPEAEILKCLCIALADGTAVKEYGKNILVFRRVQLVFRMCEQIFIENPDFFILLHILCQEGKRA